ncbi:MAG TPA: glycoside hydrolase domain-containing protein [Bryobacteraceae bacterium]|nr:glycoside hydrolase domain-containing protein [Bryobacteraceae bacterium]
MFHKGLIFRILLMLVGALRMFAQSGPAVWTVPSLHRVGMYDAPGGASQAQLYSAQNAYTAFQIAVNGGASGVSNANLTLSDLQGPGIIPASSYNPYVEGYVYVNQGSPNWGGSNQPLGPGWYADSLIPFKDPATGAPLNNQAAGGVPITVPPGQNRVFWVDLLVPQGAPAGQYSGTFTVTSNQGSSTGNISLTVWNFALPTTPSFKSAFLFWTAGNLASQEELVRHRLMPAGINSADEHTLMGMGLNATGVGPFSGASAGDCNMSGPPSVEQFRASAEAQQPGLFLYDYSADEITGCSNLFGSIVSWAQNMHQAGINNLVTMAPTPALFNDGTGTGRSAVDIWVMLPVEYDGDVANVQQALAKGDQAWSYNTLVQDPYSPKWEIDFDPINFRIQPGFISQSLGLTGLLYWRVDDFTPNAWSNPNNQGWFSSNNYPGEGMLVYPGASVGLNQVVPSMRLKWIRDGVEDYEYLQILKQSNPALAAQIANSVGANWSNWTRDANAVEQARIQAGNAIQAGGGGAVSEPAPTPSPTPAPTPAPPPACTTLMWILGRCVP